MKILASSDWHIGNMFHGTDRLPEHKDFLNWLLSRIGEEQPDALLVAGDVYDNGNPSAAAQSAYYQFLDEVTQLCPGMQVIITAGNHDSASRLEAPRALLTRHRVEVRGTIHRVWEPNPDGGSWKVDFNDLMIPIEGHDGSSAVVLAVPFLRSDVVQNSSYSKGVNEFLRNLTACAREAYPGLPLIMMAHMYATGADIAQKDASEKIIIGGQEQVDMDGWTDHPDYLTCGHIHKRQHIWNTDWARYTGSILPMSFAEIDYMHGVDIINLDKDHGIKVDFLEYTPQHKLVALPVGNDNLSPKKIQKIIKEELPDRINGKLDEHFVYLHLRVMQEKVNNDEIRELEALVETKNAVLCGIEKISPSAGGATIKGNTQIMSVDDILNRDPMETLRETFEIKQLSPMNEHQEKMLKELLESLELNQETDE